MTETELDDILLEKLKLPLSLSVVLLGFYWGYQELNLSSRTLVILDNFSKGFLAVIVAVFLIQFINKASYYYATRFSHKDAGSLKVHVIPLVKLISKVTIVILAMIWIISSLGYNVTSLLASLGIGGLAIALASQELLKNIFSGFVIMADQPFKIGDWVIVNNYEGIVQQIGLRSIRIKTNSAEYITIPNHLVTETSICNLTKYSSTRIIFTIGLTYDTQATVIEEAKKIIIEILDTTERVVKNTTDITFVNFATYSLDLRIAFNVEANTPPQHRRIKDKVNLKIKKIFDEKGIQMAFPTNTIHLKQEEGEKK